MPRAAKSGSSQPPRDREDEIALRVVVVAPPPGYVFCVQGKAGEFLGALRSSTTDLVFDVTVRATDDDPPRLLGNVAQGAPAERFLYVCSGTYAGEVHGLNSRRAKLPFATITRALVQRARKGGRLVARITGTAKDGGPACATVPLLDGGWNWQA
ncbi:MAG: hypothetical protein HZA53_05700 [Planctomycetes bacterium]|nr:hypothetical protein [Planctomycetota bacterium]